MHIGRYQDARVAAQHYLDQAQDSNIMWEVSEVQLALASVAIAEGNYPSALDWVQRGLETRRNLPEESFTLIFFLILVLIRNGLDQHAEAREVFRRVLIHHKRITEFWIHLSIVGVAAVLLAQVDQAERAVELHALMVNNPFTANSRWFADVFSRPVNAAAELLSPFTVAVAQERGRQRDLQTTVNELVREFCD